MRPKASNRSAATVGVIAGLLIVFAGPKIDAVDTNSSVWLVVCAAGIGFPAYFYVLGIPVEDRKGLWVLSAPLLRRVGSFLLAAGTVAAFAVACSFMSQFVQVDGCLDGGGRWNYERKECER